jgi:hypothetical protein
VTTFNIHTVLKIGDAIEAKVKKAVEDELARLLTDLEGVVEHVESQIVSDSGVTPVSPTPPPAPVEPTPAPEPAPEVPVEPAPVEETAPVDPTPPPADGTESTDSPPPDSSTVSDTPPA